MCVRKSKEQFIERANFIHSNRYSYNKVIYKNNRDNVIITCFKHGDYKQRPFQHLQGSGCPKCGKASAIKSRTLTIREFKAKAKNIHGNKYDYSKVIYINSQTKIEIKCPVHGIFKQKAGAHLRGNECLKCGYEKTHNFLKNKVEDFIDRSNKIHDYKYNYDKVIYINNDTCVTIICPIHGEFEQTPRSHISKKGCRKCKASQGEKALLRIFNKHKIKYIHEYTLPIYKKLRYDFYLPEYNLLIEFHGGQHFFPIDYFGGKKTFNEIKRRDIFKKALAREYKIPIIYFTYKHLRERNVFEEFVIKVINRVIKKL